MLIASKKSQNIMYAGCELAIFLNINQLHNKRINASNILLYFEKIFLDKKMTA